MNIRIDFIEKSVAFWRNDLYLGSVKLSAYGDPNESGPPREISEEEKKWKKEGIYYYPVLQCCGCAPKGNIYRIVPF